MSASHTDSLFEQQANGLAASVHCLEDRARRYLESAAYVPTESWRVEFIASGANFACAAQQLRRLFASPEYLPRPQYALQLEKWLDEWDGGRAKAPPFHAGITLSPKEIAQTTQRRPLIRDAIAASAIESCARVLEHHSNRFLQMHNGELHTTLRLAWLDMHYDFFMAAQLLRELTVEGVERRRRNKAKVARWAEAGYSAHPPTLDGPNADS
jgi:hypothetical protein